MYDEMWEDNTEDIFQSITIEQALSDSPCRMGWLSQMWAQVKSWEESAVYRTINKYQYDVKPMGKFGTIKSRRYGTYEKEMVRSINTETELTLGYSRTFGRSVPRCLSGFGDGNFFYLEESQEPENKEKLDG